MHSDTHKVRPRLSYLPIALFLITQVADGLVTYAAISEFGIEAEGNPLVKDLMRFFGKEAGLLGAKSLSIWCGISLHLVSAHLTVMVLTVFYVYAALLPWSYILAMFP